VGARGGGPGGLQQHPAADVLDQPGLLGHRQEQRGREQPSGGVLPADQRLVADRRPAAQVDDGLEEDPQIAAVQGGAQGVLDVQPVDGALAQLLVGDIPAVLALLLCPVQGRARVAQQADGVDGAGRGDGDADGDGLHDPASTDVHRLAHGGQHPVGDQHRLPLVLHVLADQRELAALQPGGGIGAAQDLFQAVTHLDQDGVAVLVADPVVDHVEAVKGTAQDGDPAAGPAGAVEGLLDPVQHQGAVGQAGERVVQCLVGQCLLGEPHLGHVLELGDEVVDHPRVVPDRGDGGARPDRLPAGAQVAAFEGEAVPGTADDASEQAGVGVRVIGVGEVLQAAAEELEDRAGQQPGRGRVDVEDLAAR
jgi:hypothetical protein